MKNNLLTISFLIISFCLASVDTIAQRESGGDAVGKEIANEPTIFNYPNSFNTSTTIKYSVPSDGKVVLKLYNATGQQITTLINDELSRGEYSTDFNASHLSAGMYICKYWLTSGNKTSFITHRLLVIK